MQDIPSPDAYPPNRFAYFFRGLDGGYLRFLTAPASHSVTFCPPIRYGAILSMVVTTPTGKCCHGILCYTILHMFNPLLLFY